VRQGVLAALRDKRGGSGKDFWLQLKCGSAEDRRTFANIASRLIPVEVQGDLGEPLTVIVNSLASMERRYVLPPERTEPPLIPPTRMKSIEAEPARDMAHDHLNKPNNPQPG
jgi:hypothetical protein